MAEQQVSRAAEGVELDPDTDDAESVAVAGGEENGSTAPSIPEEEDNRTPATPEEEGNTTRGVQQQEGSGTQRDPQEEAETESLESPEIRRRRRHQILDSSENNEDGPGASESVQEVPAAAQQDSQVAPVIDLAHSPEPAARLGDLAAPEELDRPPSLPETLASEPFPLSPPTVQEPSTSQQQPAQPIPGEAAAQIVADSEDDGHICPICFEPWSNMGDHHLACLKCGHLFGYSCIVRWLVGQSGQKGRCPQCNRRSSKKDVRKLYAKNIVVVDTTEKERIQKNFEKEREERRKFEVECANIKLQYNQKSQQLTKVLKELEVLKASVGKAGAPVAEPSNSKNSPKKRLVFSRFLEICRNGECRVMAYNKWLAMLVVSMPSQVEMFPGFGIKKINMIDLRVDCYVPLHQQLIRDLAFHPTRHDMLLSVAIDQFVKITNIQSNAAMGHFIAPAPVWCCCWSTRDANVFYVATSNGHLIQYDIRNADGPVAAIELPGTGPVVSLAYIHPCPEASLTCQGLLVARLKQCCFVDEGLARTQILRMDGTLASVSCVDNSCHVLVSFRPSLQFPHTRHAVCTLYQSACGENNGDEVLSVRTLHIFHGGTTSKKLTRSQLMRVPHDKSSLLVCAGDEATQSVYVWDVATQACLQQLQCSDTVLDVLQLCTGQTEYLAVLTGKGVRLYQWTA